MFIDLYLIGAFIKLYEAPSIKKYFNLLGLVSVCTIFLSIIYFDILGRSNPYYMIKENIMIHAFNGADILALFAAIALFLVFKDFTLGYSKAVNTIASTTFAVYLIHDNGLIAGKLWNEWLEVYKWYNSDFLIIHMIVTVLGVFVVCSFLEYVRIQCVEKPMMKKLRKYVK